MTNQSAWNDENSNIKQCYHLKFNDNHPLLFSSFMENIKQDLSKNYRSLLSVEPRLPLMPKLSSEFNWRVKSFLNSPNYEGALKYLEDDYFHLNNLQANYWNIPHSPYFSHQVPGSLPPPLASPYLFPSEIEFTEQGVKMKIFTSGSFLCRIGSHDISSLRVEGSSNKIKLFAIIEEAQEDCSQHNYVGRRIARIYYLPDPIIMDQIRCHYYSDTSVLSIQAPWLLC